MGINGSYSISVWVYLDGYAYLCFGLILRLMSTFIRRRLIQYELFFDCRCFHFHDNTYSNAVELTKNHFRPENKILELRTSAKFMQIEPKFSFF